MHEPLTTQLVGELMTKLLAAFPSRNVAGHNLTHTADVYRNGLRGLSGEAVRAAVDRSIQDDTFFPKVARLRELAAAWEKYNRVHMPDPISADPLWCGICRSRAEWKTVWRPIVAGATRPQLSADGKYVLLESTGRYKCACAAPSPFTPKPGLRPAAAPIEQLAREALPRAVRSETVVVGETSDAA